MPKGTPPEATSDGRQVVMMHPDDAVPVVASEFKMAGLDPVAAVDIAAKLVAHIEKLIAPIRERFIANIQGRLYPKVDWWTAHAFPLGYTPITRWVERVDDVFGGVETYKARVEILTRDGTVIAGGEAICSKSERNWGKRDSYALYSMAQTRATGKAFRQAMSFMAVLAGLEPTPSDEVPPGGFGKPAPPTVPPTNRSDAFNDAWDKVMKAVGEDDADVVVAMQGAFLYALTKGRTRSLTGLTDDELKTGTNKLKGKKKAEAVEWFTSGTRKISAVAPEGEPEDEPGAGPACHECGKELSSAEADASASMPHRYCSQHLAMGVQEILKR